MDGICSAPSHTLWPPALPRWSSVVSTVEDAAAAVALAPLGDKQEFGMNALLKGERPEDRGRDWGKSLERHHIAVAEAEGADNNTAITAGKCPASSFLPDIAVDFTRADADGLGRHIASPP